MATRRALIGTGMCVAPDRDEPRLFCGYPLPCQFHKLDVRQWLDENSPVTDHIRGVPMPRYDESATARDIDRGNRSIKAQVDSCSDRINSCRHRLDEILNRIRGSRPEVANELKRVEPNNLEETTSMMSQRIDHVSSLLDELESYI